MDNRNSSAQDEKTRENSEKPNHAVPGLSSASDPLKSSQTQEIPVFWLDGRSNQCSNSYGKTRAVISIGQIHLCTYTHKNVV
jgi:hypothetical protein